MFKLSKNKAEMAVLSLLGLSVVESPYVPISAPPFKKKATFHPPHPPKKNIGLNFQNELIIGYELHEIMLLKK